MTRSDLKILIPPWSLTGIVLLFWGGATGNLLVAAALAIVLEGRRWIPLRWEFDEEAQMKAFYFSMLLMVATAVLSWINDEAGTASLNVMRWMPVMFLPLEFVQRYGHRNVVTLNTFFVFTKRRLQLDREEGREVDPIEINTGYPYIFLSLIGACTGDESKTNLWFGLCGVVLLVVLSVSRRRGMRSRGLFLVAPFVLALGWGGQWVLSSVHEWVENYMEGRFRSLGTSGQNISFTSHLSELGDVKLNPRIEWRVWSEEQPVYMTLASYNNYNQGRWTYSYLEEGYQGWHESFEAHERYQASLDHGQVTYFRSEDKPEVLQLQPGDGTLIRGTITHKQPRAVVPTIDNYLAVSDIPGDVTYAEINSMGTMRFVERGPVINYRLHTAANGETQDHEPVEAIDLKIPENEKELISDLAIQLGLKELGSDELVIARIVGYFNQEFSYSTDFDPGERDYETSKLSWFLNEIKCGHCEYYAAATTLLLRECGIPARYSVGYAVSEKDGDHWNVRGLNAHAWTRAYVGGKWIHVDATPADLRGAVESKVNVVDWLREKINEIREDFYIWRLNPENTSTLVLRVGAVAVLLVLWVVFRLWRNRSREESGELLQNSWNGVAVATPLNALQRDLRRSVGTRSAGETFSQWMMRAAAAENVDAELVKSALQLHQQMRFDPEGRDVNDELKAKAKILKKQLRKR